ncbi:MAG: hypothetical protein ACSHXF_01900 [Aquaticitalea sp.]
MKSFINFLLLCFTIVSCEEAARETIEETPKAIEKQSVVFIAGIDEKDGTFYQNAKKHFGQHKFIIVEDLYNLNDIMLWLNEHADDKIYDEIHIVSKSHAWQGITVDKADKKSLITMTGLQKDSLLKLNEGITENTNIIIHSLGFGANKKLMKKLKAALSSDGSPNVYVSEFFSVFDKTDASHSLAQPFYVSFPTANSPDTKRLAKELDYIYPSAQLNWLTAMDRNKEKTAGAVYSYRFVVPVNWQIAYDEEALIPELKDANAIMDWILSHDECSLALYELGIPMEKFSWTSSSEGTILTIHGETTILTVLNPIMETYVPAKYTTPDFTHPRLYIKI